MREESKHLKGHEVKMSSLSVYQLWLIECVREKILESYTFHDKIAKSQPLLTKLQEIMPNN